MCVVAAILETIGAEAALASTALQRATVVEVSEGSLAPRTPKGQHLLPQHAHNSTHRTLALELLLRELRPLLLRCGFARRKPVLVKRVVLVVVQEGPDHNVADEKVLLRTGLAEGARDLTLVRLHRLADLAVDHAFEAVQVEVVTVVALRRLPDGQVVVLVRAAHRAVDASVQQLVRRPHSVDLTLQPGLLALRLRRKETMRLLRAPAIFLFLVTLFLVHGCDLGRRLLLRSLYTLRALLLDPRDVGGALRLRIPTILLELLNVAAVLGLHLLQLRGLLAVHLAHFVLLRGVSSLCLQHKSFIFKGPRSLLVLPHFPPVPHLRLLLLLLRLCLQLLLPRAERTRRLRRSFPAPHVVGVQLVSAAHATHLGRTPLLLLCVPRVVEVAPIGAHVSARHLP
eukprot:Rhum_TRINITY_DN14516_c33_g1::Rhum_TRINITY_DN14516_c33_g1_i1::g.94677::m.94677